MKTLKLFNAVIKQPLEMETNKNSFHLDTNLGIFIEPQAVIFKRQIVEFYSKEILSATQLNKTFYKTWDDVVEREGRQRIFDQILHYLSSSFSYMGDEDFIYIPNDAFDSDENIPKERIKLKVVKALSIDELTGKCLEMLNSGVALNQETIEDLLSVLINDCSAHIELLRDIKNKEASIILSSKYGIFPEKPEEFLRFLIYKSTGQSLLIKSKDLIDLIKSSDVNLSSFMNEYGLEKLSTIFNRFKPIFLAFKHRQSCHRKVINRISKLSKVNHVPMVENPLNHVTHRILEKEDMHWLDNATTYSLLKALQACCNRILGQDTFTYKIRNGKSFVKPQGDINTKVCSLNYYKILNYLKNKLDLSGTTFYITKGIEYALPTSEKLFLGNVPIGTKFNFDDLTVGIYWEYSWGATDLDLSGVSIAGKIGWNSDWVKEGQLYYSGDITSARKGAVEYLGTGKLPIEPTVVLNNVYSGDTECKYKIVIGQGNISKKSGRMINPNNVIFESEIQSNSKQSILGLMLPTGGSESPNCFTLLNLGSSSRNVSSDNNLTLMYLKSLYQEYSKNLSLNYILGILGAKVIDNLSDLEQNSEYVDLSINALEKDTLISIFK